METLKTQCNQQVTLIDAGTLDDDQFNHLISALDARHPIVPIILTLMIVIACASFLS